MIVTHVGVELADEAGEVAVLEVGGQHTGRELGRVPDHEAPVRGVAPRHHRVAGRVVHHLVRLQQERRRSATAAAAGPAGAGDLHDTAIRQRVVVLLRGEREGSLVGEGRRDKAKSLGRCGLEWVLVWFNFSQIFLVLFFSHSLLFRMEICAKF